MTKFFSDSSMDAMLNNIVSNSAQLCFCSAYPTTLAEATTTYKLAIVAFINTDFAAIVNGTPDGRSVSANAKSGITVDANGTITHMAWVSGTEILAVTEVTPNKVVDTSDTISSQAVVLRVADPT